MNKDWKIFLGNNRPHDGIDEHLPEPPPWRNFDGEVKAERDFAPDAETARRGLSFRARQEMVEMVNAALYLRRPLLITGKPGVGKSSLIYAVAYELKLGRVLKWPITSRATLQGGLYRYDAIGRLHARQNQEEAGIGEFLSLGPLGTALLPTRRPRALLIDEIDKSDFDLPNDLLDIFEEGEYRIPELERLREKEEKVKVRDDHGEWVEIERGRVRCRQFPFVVMTSNGERELPAPFLRRCLQLDLIEPNADQLAEIVEAHFNHNLPDGSKELIADFLDRRAAGLLATDQLLNAVFLVAGREFGSDEKRREMIEALLRSLTRA